VTDKLRMRFKKTGRAIYISHLDLMKTMQRAFSRADYPLKYSEGFNPRPQISIALPLSVGTGSVCELMDFKIKDEVPPHKLIENLNMSLPEGIEVLEVYEPQRKASALKWLEIGGVMEYDERNITEMAEKLTEFYSAPELVIIKKTKRGEGEADIKPAIRKISFEPDGDCVKLHAIISAQEPTLNPELLTEALRQRAPEIAPDFAKYTRLETYDADMKVFR
jgi:radical SAM-linked protein